ncbi:MAG: PA14 domain-containing protein [Anaerolineae bacterium]
MRKKWLSVVLVIMTLVLLIGVVPVSALPDKDCIIHIVQRGETLYSIARRYGVSMRSIARANGIVNPNRIYVGQRLVIPTVRPVGVIHVVRRGETLLGIALRYGVNAWSIARANGITNLNHIYVGQRLTIPGAAPPPSPPTPTRRPSTSLPGTYPGPWAGEYFDNVTLTGAAYTTRDDESINFNWGWGPPAGGMPTNSFSVRWTGTFSFAEGDYRFYAKVDDGVRVYVDDERIVNGWRDGGLRLYTADRALTAGEHTIKVEYYDRIQVARVYFWWKQLAGPTPTPGPSPTPGPTSTPTPAPTVTPAPGAGWFGQYYNNVDLQDPPAATRYDPWVGFDWKLGGPMPGMRGDYFSIRWTTTAYLEEGAYRFCAMIDDGARMWVDDHRVLDEWHPTNAAAYCGEHAVETGNHEIKVEYYEEGGNALIYVWWEEAD